VSAGGNPTIAYYSGDSTDAPSQSVSFEFLVIAANTTTTVTYSPIPAVHNKNLTLTATVTPQYSGTPTGTVTFTENGGTPVTITLVNGTAIYSFDPSQAGTFTIKAVYNPPTNGNFNLSSESVNLTIQ
jgi:Bacterial Ig-like domain (group 3)